MKQRTVLISGAGVAGPTLAYWLARAGFRPTVVERSEGQRSSGNPVDVRGEAMDVADRMGVLPRLREAATSVSGMAFVSASGRRVGLMAVGKPDGSELEVPRADLAAVRYDAARERAEFAFGDSITTLHQDDSGADVTFATGAPRRFDLVVGATGCTRGCAACCSAPPPATRATSGCTSPRCRWDTRRPTRARC